MKKQFIKYFIILLSVICLILLSVLIYIKSVNATSKESSNNLSSKIIDEMKYLDTNIIESMNKLNNITVIRYKVYTKTINEDRSKATSSGQSSESSSSSQNTTQSSSTSGSQNGNNERQGNTTQGGSTSQSNNSQSGNSGSSNEITISQSMEMSSLTNDSSTQIDWNAIAFSYENIYSTWPTINLDLKKFGINQELINNFGIGLDGLVQSIKAKDKSACLINLYNIYSNIPKYVQLVDEDDNFTINLYNTKLAIINSLILVSSDKWQDVTTSLSSANQSFSSILDSYNKEDYIKENYKKIKIMMEEFERSSKINDKSVFFMQYKNVMQELENI